MSTNYISNVLIPNLLDILLFIITLFIAIRSFAVNARVSNPRLLILGISMSIFALSALANLLSKNITILPLSTNWFLYTGQAVSLLFILLSLSRNNDDYFQQLIRWQIGVTILLIVLLLLAPVLPPTSNVPLKTVLQGLRSPICLGICYFYISAFQRKQTRFSLLMGIGFLLIGCGYLIIVQQYYTEFALLFNIVGDCIRAIGLILLLLAVIAG